jgi:hypothetical protein
MRLKVIGVTSFLICFATCATGQELTCRIAEKHNCARKEGCKPSPTSVWNVVDLGRKQFSRCDSRGCDTYPATISESGIYLAIDVPGRGLFAKMLKDGTEIVEVASLGTSVLISFGTCSQK